MEMHLNRLLILCLAATLVAGKDPRTQPKMKKGAAQKVPTPPKVEPVTPPSHSRETRESPKSIEEEIKIRETLKNDRVDPPVETVPEPTDSLATKTGNLVRAALSQNLSIYLALIDVLEAKTGPLLGFLREKAMIGSAVFALVGTLLFLRIVSWVFGKKHKATAATADNSAAIQALSSSISAQFVSVKADLEKLVGGVAGKVGDLQKQFEKMASEKKDEEQMDFLCGNLGDLWKEIKDLKTRINEVDGAGSNLLSFNSKMEIKGLGGKERGGLDDDEDSSSRKNGLLEFGNQILPKELSSLPPTPLIPKEEPAPPKEKTPEVKEPPRLPAFKSPAKPTLPTPVTSRLEISPVTVKAPLPTPPIPSVTSANLQGDETPASTTEGRVSETNERRPSQPQEQSAPSIQPEDETGRAGPFDPPADFRPPTFQPRVPLPANLPKTQKKGPQMHRALPPKAPGAPVPKANDSNNLI